MTWAVNEWHDTDESENEATKMITLKAKNTDGISTYPLKEHEEQGDDNSTMDTSALPKWLRERPDMIYPHSCTEKGQQLGKGQYGTVFKGKLVLGNSVYVDIICKSQPV